MEIMQYTFNYFDRLLGKRYREVRFGKVGAEWDKIFDDNKERFDCETEIKVIELKEGVDFKIYLTSGIIEVRSILENGDIGYDILTDGRSFYSASRLSPEGFEEMLNKLECEYFKEVA